MTKNTQEKNFKYLELQNGENQEGGLTPTKSMRRRRRNRNNLQENEFENQNQYQQINQNENNNNISNQDHQNNSNNDNFTPIKILKKLVFFVLGTNTLYLVYYLFVDHIEHSCSEQQFEYEDDCIQGVLVPRISYWIKIISLCSIISVAIIILALKRILSIIFVPITVSLIVYLSLFKYDLDPRYITIRNYEGAHGIFIGVSFIIYFILGMIGWSFIHLYYKNRKRFFIVASIIVFTFLLISFKLRFSCDKWEQGLYSELDFSKQYCKVNKPTICWPNVVDNWFNLGPNTCKIQNKELEIQELFKEYGFNNQPEKKSTKELLNQWGNYLIWPLTNNMSFESRKPQNILRKVRTDTKRSHMSLEQIKQQEEAETIIDIENMEMIINVTRDEQLVEQRKQQQDQDIESKSQNIIILYVDTVSRTQSFRKLKKTMNFLKRYTDRNYKNDEKLDETQYTDKKDKQKYKKNKTVFEFFRYHSIDNKTITNLFQLHYGYQKKRIIESLNRVINEFNTNKKRRSLFDDFKKAGYIVSHASNTCSWKCVFRNFYVKNTQIQDYFRDEPADHEFFLYDPLYINKDNYSDTKRGCNSIYRRCIYGKDTNEHVFEYGLQFMRQYKDDKKVVYLEFTDGHEITSEVVQYIDDPMYRFLTTIEKEGMLEKDTILYLLSDHGQHLLSAFYVFGKIQGKASEEINDVYSTERMLPMMYILVTNDLLRKNNQQLAQNLEKNEQSIFGMGELRQTFLSNAFGEKYLQQVIEKKKQSKEKFLKEIQSRYDDKDAKQFQFCDVEYDKNLLDHELDKEKTCYDIGMEQFDNQEEFCSCKIWRNNDDKNNNNKFLDSKKDDEQEKQDQGENENGDNQ